jgi:hypothetical protein
VKQELADFVLEQKKMDASYTHPEAVTVYRFYDQPLDTKIREWRNNPQKKNLHNSSKDTTKLPKALLFHAPRGVYLHSPESLLSQTVSQTPENEETIRIVRLKLCFYAAAFDYCCHKSNITVDTFDDETYEKVNKIVKEVFKSEALSKEQVTLVH